MRSRRLFMLVAVMISMEVGAPQVVMAEGAALKRALAEKRALENKVEALDRKVQQLEQRLDQSLGNAVGAKVVVTPAAKTEQVEALDQKVRILERRWELEQEAVAAKAKEAPIIGTGKDGFFVKSADGNFQLRLRGYVQADGRFYADDQDHLGTDTFLMRRVRPIVEGTVFKNFDFRIMPDFGGSSPSLFDAYADVRFWPEAKLRVGKFKPPVGLERLQSGADLLFVERGLPTNLVPNRDIGAQVFGDLWNGAFSYALGAFNGAPDNVNGNLDNNDDKDFAGRIFFHPFKNATFPFENATFEPLRGFGIGASGTYGDHAGTVGTPNLPSYVTPGQLTFFRYRSDGTDAGTTIASGQESRYSPQGYFYWGPFGLLGEYVRISQSVQRNTTSATLDHDAWQVQLSYVLTGENATYGSLSPAKPFDLAKGTWGAFQVAGQYGELHVDKDTFPTFANPNNSARIAKSWGLGLNWYLNRNFKFVLNYEQTDFTGGSSQGERPKERAVLGRFQISY